jgi:hypothetical protein
MYYTAKILTIIIISTATVFSILTILEDIIDKRGKNG